MTDQIETKKDLKANTLPMVVRVQPQHDVPNEALFRYRLPSSFASQLVASKLRLDSQRTLRRAPTNVAVEAYRAANARKVKRMPAGFNQTLSA